MLLCTIHIHDVHTKKAKAEIGTNQISAAQEENIALQMSHTKTVL